MPFVNSEYGKLKKVLLCRPEYLSISTPINKIAEKYNKDRDNVNIEKACKQHDEFVEVFKSYGVEVLLSKTNIRYPYEVNTRDLGVTTTKGIIFGRYLCPMHWGEHRLAEKTLYENNVPIYYKMNKGTFEGGDFIYINKKLAAVGIGIRTNMLGVNDLRIALYDADIELVPVDFDEDYLHLDKIFNVIGEKVAVVCPDALPEQILNRLNEEKFELIKVSKEDVFLEACNLLNIGNDTVFSYPQAKKVNEKLRALGFKVEILNLEEVSKSGGGLRCMSFPIERE